MMTEGRLAMVADPSGAVLGLWQPLDHRGADVFDRSGSMVWNETCRPATWPRPARCSTPRCSAGAGRTTTAAGTRSPLPDAKQGDDKTVAEPQHHA
ncbi:MAG: hypothetical protein MZU95_09300 [Desulfomicrobium escambiense]|nr:hypothetical protein [Desulfomicrobium escambiense]